MKKVYYTWQEIMDRARDEAEKMAKAFELAVPDSKHEAIYRRKLAQANTAYMNAKAALFNGEECRYVKPSE